MLYELRIYDCCPGRLPALHERFRKHTLGFFKKYGIKPVGFWTNMVGPSNQQLIYLVEWESLAHREQAWGKFVADPEWQAVLAESEKDGRIVANVSNAILQPADYSLMH